MTKKRILLVVGHNEVQRGEFSPTLNNQEWVYWHNIAMQVWDYFSNKAGKYEVNVAIRNYKQSYTKEMKEVVFDINNSPVPYDYVFELHFNGVSDKSVNGAECLVFHKSSSHEIAKRFLNKLHSEFGIKNRGLKYVKSSSERGGYGICKSKAPYILLEPFFGTNEKDSEKFKDDYKIIQFFIDFIEEL